MYVEGVNRKSRILFSFQLRTIQLIGLGVGLGG